MGGKSRKEGRTEEGRHISHGRQGTITTTIPTTIITTTTTTINTTTIITTATITTTTITTTITTFRIGTYLVMRGAGGGDGGGEWR
jgi:hypothetical protein